MSEVSTSAFNVKPKVYKSDITGEEREYRVNNYLWIVMEKEFELSQSEFDKQAVESPDLATCKFVTCVLLANGVETTLEDVAQNTDQDTVNEFYDGFFKLAFPKQAEYLEMLRAERAEPPED